VSGDNNKALWVAAPGAAGSAFTITAHILGFATVNQFPAFGLFIGDTGNKMVLFGFEDINGSDTFGFVVNRFTNPTTFNSTPLATARQVRNGDWWLRIVYDGTNFQYQSSLTGTDASTFQQWYTEAANGFLATAPAKIGIYATSQNTGANVKATLVYWSVTQP
jgi:hypothetical protein